MGKNNYEIYCKQISFIFHKKLSFLIIENIKILFVVIHYYIITFFEINQLYKIKSLNLMLVKLINKGL